MWWKRSSTPLVPAHAAPVPDAEALRQAALKASWQRSQRVARRRLAWRWLLWSFPRYLLPLLLLLGGAGWLWQSLQPVAKMPTAHSDAPLVTAVPVPTTAPSSALPDGEQDAALAPLRLRFDRSLPGMPRGPATRSTGSSRAEPSTDTDAADIHPTLKPETWLHSKEP